MLVTAIAPNVLLPRLNDRQRWKRGKNLWVKNPNYENAEYEMVYHRMVFNSRDFFGTWGFGIITDIDTIKELGL